MNKVSLLIVDDNEVDRYILKRQLKETGLDVRIFEAESGKEALEFFEGYEENQAKYADDFPPLVIFLDINMPLVSGFEFLDKFGPMRNSLNIETAFIMMFSSSESEQDRDKAFSYGYVKDYLTKGQFSSDQLREKICGLSA